MSEGDVTPKKHLPEALEKYVMAKSALGAIRLDKKTPVHDCWIDEDWKKQQTHELASCIGFSAEKDYEEE